MADNCPFWKNRKCAPPGEPATHDCSYLKRDYNNCAVYKMNKVKTAGGSMEDMLQAAGAIPSGSSVVGGRGRILSDDDINSLRTKPTKKWWQFWKK